MRWSRERWENDERTRIMEILVSQRSTLESELYARIFYTKSVAAYVSLRPTISMTEYDNLAAELVGQDPMINSMALSPKGVIGAIYPKSDELKEVIGLNLFAHPERKKIVEETIRTGKTFVAGPVELVEGGMAFISYTPIFDKTKPAPFPFWGMTDIVIKRDELYRIAGLEEKEKGVLLAMRGYDGEGNNGAVFFGEEAIFDQNPVTVRISLPDGEWILAGVPVGGWSGYLNQDRAMFYWLLFCAVLIAILTGVAVDAILRLRASRKELNQLNVDKDHLLSIIAHDLRSPLGAVQSLAYELMSPGEFEVKGAGRELVEMIHKTSSESLILLENLLSWVHSRRSGSLTQKEDFQLSPLVENVADFFQPTAQNKKVSLEHHIPPGTSVRIDPRVLEVVLRNLLSNAIKFSRTGGSVTLGVGELRKGKYTVSVRDEGIGMTKERIDSFHRGSSNGSERGTASEKGTGIGLSLCRGLLSQSGEDIWIESVQGEGTTVWFTLTPGTEK